MNQAFFKERGITSSYPDQGGYKVYASAAQAAALQELEFVQEVKKQTMPADQADEAIILKSTRSHPSNADNMETFYIPAAGASIAITPLTLQLYQDIIRRYENQGKAVIRHGKLYLDGKEQQTYTFRQNYYFMLGDNRHNSLDSRFWGFVPEDHVVGKALFVCMSTDPEAGWLDSIRWERLFTRID
ncbi:signal peptidase I [Pontibacter sp. CAU 1760]